MTKALDNAFIYIYIACSACLAITCIFTFRRIYLKSQSKFAYTLLMFSAGLCVHDFYRFYEWFKHIENEFYYVPGLYFYFLLANQTWIFSMQYLLSSIVSSEGAPIMTIEQHFKLKWYIIFGYSSFIILLCISVLCTCPGKNEETSS